MRWVRPAVVWAVALALATACTGEMPSHHPGRSARSRPPRVSHLRPLVLRADLSDPSVPWHLVTRIPFGPRREELGIIPRGPHSPVPMVPFAFAVAPDGSFWVLDEVKRRIAHYSRAGRYLGDVGGLHFDRFHPHPRDLVMAGEDAVVLEQRNDTLAGVFDTPVSGGGFRRTPMVSGDRPVQASFLVPTDGPIVAWVSGRVRPPPELLSRSPRGYARVDRRSGRVHPLPGLPLEDGNFLRLDLQEDNQNLIARFSTADSTSVLPIHVLVVAGGRAVRAFVGPQTQTALAHGIASFVQLTPSDPQLADRFGGGRWVLGLSDDGSALVWERIRRPAFDDETVVRHLTVGPGDALYLMQADRKGIALLRR